MKKEIVIACILIVCGVCCMTWGVCGLLNTINTKVAKHNVQTYSIKVRSETTNDIIYEGEVTSFYRYVADNGARFVDANGVKQSIQGNVVVLEIK